MSKINRWQDKSFTYVNKGLHYLDKIDALGKDEQLEPPEINFKLEKVCWCANFQSVIELLSLSMLSISISTEIIYFTVT